MEIQKPSSLPTPQKPIAIHQEEVSNSKPSANVNDVICRTHSMENFKLLGRANPLLLAVVATTLILDAASKTPSIDAVPEKGT